MNQSMPTVSIIIPTYNRADYLPRAINSVLEQTFEDFELIIVDDASTDETPQIVRRYTDDRIHYIQFEENQGANAARNAGIRAADGEFIALLDSDDAFRPRHLEVTTDRLQCAPSECAGVFTSFAYIKDGEMFNVSYVPEGIISYEEMQGNPIGGFCAMMFRPSVFNEVGMPDEHFAYCDDLEFFLRILRQHTLIGINEILFDCFVHNERMSSEPELKLRGYEKILKKHGDNLPPLFMGYIHYARALTYAEHGELRAARREFLRAIRANPKKLRYYYHLGATLFGVRGFEASMDIKQQLNLLRGQVGQ